MKNKASVSQERIARALGLSQALVSLVLNGKRENISEESYQRIWSYAVKLGYRPKGMQLASDSAPATNVGFILRAGLRLYTQSNFFSHVQHGLHAGLLAKGYHTMFLGAEDDWGVRKVEQMLRRHRLFGLAVLGQIDESIAKALKAVQPNLVAISVSYPGLCHSVMPNEKQAIEQLTSHLSSLGHKRFGWVGGDRDLDYNKRRYAGVVDALASRNLKVSPKFTVDVQTGDRLAGWKAGEILLSQNTPRTFPTAFICTNGSVARGFINCVMQKGWRIPERFSVVAIDATRLCVEEHPQITGAHSDPEKIGNIAAELLLRSAESNDGILSDVIVPAQLTVRETSAKPPA